MVIHDAKRIVPMHQPRPGDPALAQRQVIVQSAAWAARIILLTLLCVFVLTLVSRPAGAIDPSQSAVIPGDVSPRPSPAPRSLPAGSRFGSIVPAPPPHRAEYQARPVPLPRPIQASSQSGPESSAPE